MIKATFACLAAAAVGAEVGRSVAGDEDNLRRRRCRELVRHGDPLSIGSSASWRRDSSKASNSRRREIGEEESIRTIPIAAPTIALVALHASEKEVAMTAEASSSSSAPQRHWFRIGVISALVAAGAARVSRRRNRTAAQWGKRRN